MAGADAATGLRNFAVDLSSGTASPAVKLAPIPSRMDGKAKAAGYYFSVINASSIRSAKYRSITSSSAVVIAGKDGMLSKIESVDALPI